VLAVSERFACRVTGQNRTTHRHQPICATLADPDAALRAWLRDYAKDHPRRGFRPAYHVVRGDGWYVNHKKIQRLWRDEGLRVPQRRRRKRHGASTSDAPSADAPDRVWAVDFQFDATTDGRPLKIVSIVDEHTRECLGDLVARSITADELIAELDRIAAQRGTYPAVLRCDNGPELICAAMADWATGGVGLYFIPPGAPWRNGYVESFNSRIRDECLNINSFWCLTQARIVIGDWKTEYNANRRHSALKYLAPTDYAAICTHR
jgi:transposase InsO family protein